MRECKFRAWCAKHKRWLCGYEMPHLGGFSLFGEVMMLGEWSHILDRFIFQRDGHTGDDLIVMLDNGPKTTLMTSKGTLSNRAVKSNAASLTRQRWDETRRVNHPPISMFRVSVTLQLVFGCGPHSEQRTYGIADRLDENNDFPHLT